MTEITQLLLQVERGDQISTERLFALLYDELRRTAKLQMAKESVGHTLQATALVHEAFVRLLGSSSCSWENRVHFFSAAAEAMRRILVENARAKSRRKRGGGAKRVELSDDDAQVLPAADELLDLDEALIEFEQAAPEQAKLVKLRFFGGLTMPQIAELLNISLSTAERQWSFARAWLRRRIKSFDDDANV